MSKFNLKNYQKIDGDQHIDSRLQEQHEDSKNSITEDQLKDRRVGPKDVILESLLNGKRLGSAEVIIEKNLNDSKGMFAPLRNSETYTGNINKIEEKRLAGEKTEDEKYEPAAKTPKVEKWWEHLAKDSSKIIVTAAPNKNKNPLRQVLEDDRMDKFTPQKGFELAKEMGVGDDANEGLVPDKGDVSEFIGSPNPEPQDEQEPLEKELGAGEMGMEFTKSKVSEKPMPNMLFQLKFDPQTFDNNPETIKEEALDMILTKYPNLSGKISTDDFNDPTMKGPQSLITMVLIGPEYFKANTQVDLGSSLFNNLEIEETDDGGTPVTLGRIKLSPQAVTMAKEDREGFLDAIEQYVIEEDPSLQNQNVSQYLDFSALAKGEVTFVLGANTPTDSSETSETSETEVSEDFPIEDVDMNSMDNQDEFPIEEEPTQASSKSIFQNKNAAKFADEFKQKKN